MKIDTIGCLHGYYPELPGGDLLIVTGDLTARDTEKEYNDFFDWLNKQDYKKKIFIGGNHDNLFKDRSAETFRCRVRRHPKTNQPLELFEYLNDSLTVFQDLKIWGSPWTKTFPGMNPKCKAFAVDTEEELAEKWALIPKDIDILICHSPPYGVLDGIPMEDGSLFHVGSKSLRNAVLDANRFKKLKLVVFSHIHEGYGQFVTPLTTFVNCSIMNERYEPVNKPIRIEL